MNKIQKTKIESFNNPKDEEQLRLLDEMIASLDPKEMEKNDFSLLLNIFERFPENDGLGVFWSILHFLEACNYYEPVLIESIKKKPALFTITMLNRLLNAGIKNVKDTSLISVLETIEANDNVSENLRILARQFIEYQYKKGNA